MKMLHNNTTALAHQFSDDARFKRNEMMNVVPLCNIISNTNQSRMCHPSFNLSHLFAGLPTIEVNDQLICPTFAQFEFNKAGQVRVVLISAW